MIDYEYLCQAIDDWKAGRRPSAPPPPTHMPGADPVEEMDSGVVMVEEGESYGAYGEPEAYDQPHEEPEGYDQTMSYAPEGYEGSQSLDQPAGYDQTQAYVGQSSPSGQTDPGHAGVDELEELDLEAEDEDDDWQRDYDLEAVDDAAAFDLYGDLQSYFVAEHQIERGWEDRGQRHALFSHYGIRDEPHFYQVKATVDRFINSDEGQARWGDIGTIMQLKANAAMDQAHAEMQQRLEGELAGEMEPVEGVSLQQWAHAQARIVSGGDVDEVCAELGIDGATWERVSAEWNDRMARDTTTTIATEYGRAFSSAGQGQYGAAGAAGAAGMAPGGDVEGEPPVPLETYVEVMVAQNLLVPQGFEAAAVLEEFGMTVLDWSNVSAWWGAYLNRHMMENEQALYHRFNELQAEFEAKYASED